MLEQQRLKNQAEAEATRKRLLQLQAESNAVEAQGQATADAKAKAAAAEIDAQASVAMAKATAEAMRIEATQRLEMLALEQKAEIEHQQALMNLEIEKAVRLTWPTGPLSYRLESSSDSIDWRNADVEPRRTPDHFEAVFPSEGPHQFFRLVEE